MDIEVRPLIVDDVFTVAAILSKGTKAGLAAVVKAEGKVNPTEVGIGSFLSLFVDTKEELKAWLADLIGKTKEEFISMPPTTLITVIKELRKQEEFSDFLAQVKELWAEMGIAG